MKLRGILLVMMLMSVLGATVAPAQVTHNSVTLTWTTPGDDSLIGTAAQFDIRYSTAAITAANYASASTVTGEPTPSASGSSQSFTVTGLTPNTTYWFAIKSADEVPNWSLLSNVISRTTLAAPDVTRPAPLAIAVSASTDSTVTLGWTAVGDDSLTGTATSYDVRYSTSPITAANFASATAITGEPTPAIAGTAQSVMVRGLSRQVTYWFAAKVTDDAGNPSAISNVPSATTPDTMPPAAINNLAASFVWVGWNAAMDVPRRSRVRA
jgi:chitodextrinase